jgi:outer membrane receptor protein involved in Fe transport
LAGTAAAALLAGMGTAALAQGAADQTETVVVSASRITASGFSAPTPTTVVGSEEIQQNAQPNVFNTVAELPALQGSTGTMVNNGGASGGLNGLSTLNVRGLGTNRSLTLIDGQRVVAANVGNLVDVSQFPQLLISRVDIVTGGASASWGSDAVGGVVNFVTQKNFNGVKGNVSTGVSKYGDETFGLVQLAAGTGFSGGKGHFEASVEAYHNDGIGPVSTGGGAGLPGGALSGGRCCQSFVGVGGQNDNLRPYAYTTPPRDPANPNAANNYFPQMTYLSGPINGSQTDNFSTYGLITNTALKGTMWLADGSTAQFRYGTQPNGQPCSTGSICMGGDLTNIYMGNTQDASMNRGVFYSRLSYDLTPDLTLYGTVSLGLVQTSLQPNPGHTAPTQFTIACGNAPGGPNAYLSADINAACVANKITNFSFGVSALTMPNYQRLHIQRRQRRYVLGADGNFDLFGNKWTYDAYFEHGENDLGLRFNYLALQPHFVAAVDAVKSTNGTIVCRSAAAQATGCLPINFFGNNAIDPAAFLWINPAHGSYQLTGLRQEAAAFTVNGTPFKTWAGDVSMAFGLEYREEAYRVVGDPYSDGVTATNPNTADYPGGDGLLSAAGNNWYEGNYHSGSGNYHVEEGFLELGVPLLDSPAWGKVDADLAGRATGYSTSGYNQTWKVGLTWDTPVNGLRLRALQSRDVRAPNLSDLFAAPISTSNSGLIDRSNGNSITVLGITGGNPNLKPETAQSTELGIVYQPEWLPGFNASVDYYRIGLKKKIGSLSNQQIIDGCQIGGNQSYCSVIQLTGVFGTPTGPFVRNLPFNLASEITDGFDIEMSYQSDLAWLDLPGNVTLRGLSTHVSKFIVDPGVPGTAIIEYAGNVTRNQGGDGGVPLWKNILSQSWSTDPVTVTVTERFFSDGAIDPYAIECQGYTCPAPTLQHATVNINHTQGPFFVDIGGSYKFGSGMQAYFKIDNITDYLPRTYTPSYEYDFVGRMFRVGLRFET